MRTILQTRLVLLVWTLLIEWPSPTSSQLRNACYNQKKEATKCYTPFVNPAFKVPVHVTNQCGEDGKELFCMQDESTKTARSCGYCDAHDPSLAHPASYLTDYHSHDNKTWWQSSTMTKNIQHPYSVNFTINLGKAYDITYIKLIFFSSRPESFAIYKKNADETEDWVPFQYFSASCEDTYGVVTQDILTKENEDKATCREDHSDISPLTGGTVVFSTLEGRPSAYQYENTPSLQDWVSATEIMVSLNRLNTFRDEVFGDKQVLSQYFYGIYDFSIGGRCKCYGHATDCVNDEGALKCLCQHFTDGDDCQKCLPFFNDQPWHRATVDDAHECKPCDCNGLSETCEFDAELYERTGHGGHCTNCRESTSGPHCEVCQHGHYHRREDKKCVYCHCHPLGSVTTQCNDYGVCACQPGVTGEKCDQCLPNYYNLTETGCTKCSCERSGVMEGAGEACDVVTGQCYCKEFVTGMRCDQCTTGFYGLLETNHQGCTSCFCYGHSLDCSLDAGHRLTTIKSTFTQGMDGWTAVGRQGEEASLEHLDISHEISLVANYPQAYYFVAPDAFLGDLHRSYGLHVTFKLRIDSSQHPARPSSDDIIIESANGGMLTLPILSQGNAIPTSGTTEFRFKLAEHRHLEWTSKQLSHLQFMRLLSNVTAIKIRGTYTSQGVGFLSDFALETSIPINNIRSDSSVQLSEDVDSFAVVERCKCPDGYLGQFCEDCAPGFKRLHSFSGPFGTCVKCECNNHADVCETESGRCICKNATTGDNCQFCSYGYYGDARIGTESDCHACGCPGMGPCKVLESTGEIICLDCEDRFAGMRCQDCLEGYYGKDCLPCNCNNNSHPNEVAVCHRVTGKCLSCSYNTMGDSCELCRDGYYGNPLEKPHGMCKACACHELGSVAQEEEEGSGEEVKKAATAKCHLQTGQCACKSNVEGLQCDTCVNGTWNIFSGTGCEDCGCDPMGAIDGNCDVYTGKCVCKKGVAGDKCTRPQYLHYGFSVTGALECLCDPYGSTSDECDLVTGQCPCKPQYKGRMCNQCELNRFDLQRGCIACPVCYNIVMEEAAKVKEQIERMMDTFKQAQNLPDNFFEDDSEYNDLAKILRADLQELESSLKSHARADELKWFVDAASELERINTVYANISEHTSHLPADINTNKAEIRTTSELLEGFKDEIQNLTQVLNQQKEELLEQIKERQRQSGRQSDDLTNVAKQAREIVLDLETKLSEVDEMLEQIKELNAEIIGLHQKWGTIVTERDEKVAALQNLNALMTEKYKKVMNETEVAKERVVVLLNVSGVLLQEVDVEEVPFVDMEKLNGTYFLHILKTDNQKAEEQLKALEDLHSLFHQTQRNLTLLLSSTHIALADRKGLDETAHQALNRSKSAYDKVEEVFMEASKILETFKAFDEKIESSREKSEKAIASVGDPQETYVKEIHEKLQESWIRMAGPAGDVNADDLEHRNNELVSQMLKRTQELDEKEKEFARLENSTDVIEVFVSEVDQQLDQAEAELAELEIQNHNDTLALEELQDILAQINLSIAETNNALSMTNAMADELQYYFAMHTLTDHGLDPIEEEKMKKLSVEIEKFQGPAQGIIEHSIFDTLETEQARFQNVSDEYTKELAQLESDVTNLEKISISIPQECFKPIALEPVYKEE